MTTDETERLVLAILGEYEGSVREYLRKIEDDKPAIAQAYWAAVWDLRKKVITEFEFLRIQLKQAKFARDPD